MVSWRHYAHGLLPASKFCTGQHKKNNVRCSLFSCRGACFMFTKILLSVFLLLGTALATANATSDAFNPHNYKRAFILGSIISGQGFPAVGSKVIWRHGTATLEQNNTTHKYRLVFKNFKHRFSNLTLQGATYTHPVSTASAKRILAILKNPAGCKILWQHTTCYSQKIKVGTTYTAWVPSIAHYYVVIKHIYPHNVLMHIDAIRFSGKGQYIYVFK